MQVHALVHPAPGRPDLHEATCAALQSQAGEASIETSRWHEADIGAARRAGAWLWLLDGVTVPERGALAAFQAALEALEGLPEPVALASKVLDTAGGLHPDAAPRHEIFEKQLTVDAVARGLVQLRAVPSGSVLVRADAFERFGPLREDLPLSWSVFEFTARLLRSSTDTGYLVPTSVAVRGVPPRPTGRHGGALRSRARLLTGPVWSPTERLWEGFQVAEGVLRGARGPAHRA